MSEYSEGVLCWPDVSAELLLHTWLLLIFEQARSRVRMSLCGESSASLTSWVGVMRLWLDSVVLQPHQRAADGRRSALLVWQVFIFREDLTLFVIFMLALWSWHTDLDVGDGLFLSGLELVMRSRQQENFVSQIFDLHHCWPATQACNMSISLPGLKTNLQPRVTDRRATVVKVFQFVAAGSFKIWMSRRKHGAALILYIKSALSLCTQIFTRQSTNTSQRLDTTSVQGAESLLWCK